MILVKLCVEINLKSVIYLVFRKALKLFSDGHILIIFSGYSHYRIIISFKIIKFQALT